MHRAFEHRLVSGGTTSPRDRLVYLATVATGAGAHQRRVGCAFTSRPLAGRELRALKLRMWRHCIAALRAAAGPESIGVLE